MHPVFFFDLLALKVELFCFLFQMIAHARNHMDPCLHRSLFSGPRVYIGRRVQWLNSGQKRGQKRSFRQSSEHPCR